MPKSKVRKKPDYAGRPAAAGSASSLTPTRRPSPAWYPIVMIALLVIGLVYIVVYYLASDSIGFMNSLGGWNFAIGFGFLAAGLGMAVRWR